MEPITLITTAIALATPYLIKTGEKVAEGVGEEIVKVIKKPFTKHEETTLVTTLQSDLEKEKLKEALLLKINEDESYKIELETAVKKAQKDLQAYQQNINNNGGIDKQINIQNITGDINF